MSTFNISYIVYFLFVVDFWNAFGIGLEEGDQCLFKDGTLGVCKFLTSCQFALESLKVGIFPQNVCGFKGTKSIFCCNETGPIISRTPGEISKQKCKEYAQYAYEKKEPTGSQILNFSKCVTDDEIVGIIPARISEFPHMALIGAQTGDEAVNWYCGGSLISENFILTAGHCLNSHYEGSAKFVRIGLTNLTDLTTMQERTVSGIIPYPKYTDTKRYHDIGLLKVSRNFDLHTYARPACLQTEKTIQFNKAITSGWSRIEFTGADSDRLLKIFLDVFDTDKCNKTYINNIIAPYSKLKDGILGELMICAGVKAGDNIICLGFFSGPLQVYHEDTKDNKCMFEIVGIASFSRCREDIPGVYTRVTAYIKWIEDTVWP